MIFLSNANADDDKSYVELKGPTKFTFSKLLNHGDKEHEGQIKINISTLDADGLELNVLFSDADETYSAPLKLVFDKEFKTNYCFIKIKDLENHKLKFSLYDPKNKILYTHSVLFSEIPDIDEFKKSIIKE